MSTIRITLPDVLDSDSTLRQVLNTLRERGLSGDDLSAVRSAVNELHNAGVDLTAVGSSFNASRTMSFSTCSVEIEARYSSGNEPLITRLFRAIFR
jgi:hypothetical protein